jgi:ATP-dependent exoDNAse (exonuclease V) alpha subunit
VDRLQRCIELLHSSNLFLTGGAGVGKSFLTKQIATEYIKSKKSVVLLGSTGISAVNINGQTIHSFFIFNIASNFDELMVSDKYSKSRLKELNKILSKLDLLIIDEISMVSSNIMDMIVYRLRNGNFKGRVLVVGDFFQLPPIIKKNSSHNIFDQNIYAFESSGWSYLDFTNINLTKIKRTTDREFMNILSKLRVGNSSSEVIEYLTTIKEHHIKSDEPTILYGRNVEADKLNRKKLDSIPQKVAIISSQKRKSNPKVSDKRIQSWINSLPIEDELILKERAKVIFTTNKWDSYYNGQRAIIEHIEDDYIVVSCLKTQKLIRVERATFELTKTIADGNDIKSEVEYTLKQFPLRLCYAITIHKSQGMSIDDLICNVDSIFATSQFYVAISRAIDPKTLKIEYSRNNFKEYLKRVIQVSENVKQFYNKSSLTEIR